MFAQYCTSISANSHLVIYVQFHARNADRKKKKS